MALDSFEDDPIADAEIMPPEWRREARAAQRSWQRMQRRQERMGIDPGLENLGELAGGGAAAPAGGGNDALEALRDLVDTAHEIRELLEQIKESLPLGGAYGP